MKTEFDPNTYITHHIQNGTEWHLPFLPTIHLPTQVTLHGLMLIFAGFFMFLLFVPLYNKKKRVPHGLTNCLEGFIVYIRDEMVYPNVGKEDGRKLMPFFCTLFFFILTLNIMGLIPLFSTATANISVTAGIAMTTLFYMSFGAMRRNGIVKFSNAFIPSGVPKFILLILIPIEILGFFIKPVALTLRLFANMVAGHIVILSLIGLVVSVGVFAYPTLILALFMYFLEIMVAFLQAYVFTLLSAIFIGQVYHPSH